MFEIRASSLALIMTNPRGADKASLSETAKSHLISIFKDEYFNYPAFSGSKYTEKGHAVEDEAIFQSSILDGVMYEKNEEEKHNGWVKGTCDIFTGKKIIDIKNSWGIGTHCFFQSEADKKTKDGGYEWQLWAYMWLWGVTEAELHYWLLPTPEEILGKWGDEGKHITLVNQIPIEKRRTIQSFKFDESLIEKVKAKITLARKFYKELEIERKIAGGAAC